MPSFRIRPKIEATGGMELNDGSWVTKIICGSAALVSPAYADQTSGSTDACPITVVGAQSGCKVFVSAGSVPAGLLVGAGEAGTDLINVTFTTSGCVAVNAAAITVNYLIVGTG